MRIVTPAQMRELDRRAQAEFGISGLILMENAGARAADHIAARLGEPAGAGRVVVVCGTGNNGGDGLVAARHLHNRGYALKVFLAGAEAAVRGDALVNYAIVRRLAIDCTALTQPPDAAAARILRSAAVIVDALYGIGLNKPVTGLAAEVIDLINRCGRYIVALDVPSGLCAASGRAQGACVRAQETLTCGVMKQGLLTDSGRRQAGKIYVLDIGLPRQLLEALPE
ncbi:MAG: NAD(P)H-hydrate epimerase [Candidatus Omnitrophica bacterium]|nr:NAD(P)H-hydrate epimerase [Candidatus Omnitrophota bacterium]